MKKALFLDRDGVINYDYGYVGKIENFDIRKEIFNICLEAQKFGFIIIVITNQAGIGRGKFTLKDFLDVAEFMIQEFEARHIYLTAIYFCPYHPTHGIGYYLKDSIDRKPNPGMLIRAISSYNVDPEKSIMVGDKKSDKMAARKAKVKYFVNSNNSNWNQTVINLVKKK